MHNNQFLWGNLKWPFPVGKKGIFHIMAAKYSFLFQQWEKMTEIFNKDNNNVHQIFIANTQGDYGLSEQTFLAHFLSK